MLRRSRIYLRVRASRELRGRSLQVAGSFDHVRSVGTGQGQVASPWVRGPGPTRIWSRPVRTTASAGRGFAEITPLDMSSSSELWICTDSRSGIYVIDSELYTTADPNSSYKDTSDAH